MRKTLIALLALTAIGLLTGKSTFATKPPTILITADGYVDYETKVSQGDTVWWVNEDNRPHSAKSDDGKSFDTGEMDTGDTTQIVISMTPGKYPYHDFYSAFKGMLIVNDPWIVDASIGPNGKPISVSAALFVNDTLGLSMSCRASQTAVVVFAPQSSRFSGNTAVVYKFDNGADHTAEWAADKDGNLDVSNAIGFIKEMVGHHLLNIRANNAVALDFNLGDPSRAIDSIRNDCGF